MTPTDKPLVLVIDDEPQIQRLLTVTLEANHFRVLAASSGQEGLSLAAQHRPAVVLLDLGLPDLRGNEVLRRLREWSDVPVVILSVEDDEAGKVSALDEGADDYVTKPFNTAELLARLRVALRHVSKAELDDPTIQIGRLTVDLAHRRVTNGSEEIKLTATEYNLLRYLVRHAGKVITHRQLLREVWGPGHEDQTHYLRVYVARLRDKLEDDPSQPKLILSEQSVGYRFANRDA